MFSLKYNFVKLLSIFWIFRDRAKLYGAVTWQIKIQKGKEKQKGQKVKYIFGISFTVPGALTLR